MSNMFKYNTVLMVRAYCTTLILQFPTIWPDTRFCLGLKTLWLCSKYFYNILLKQYIFVYIL